MADAKLTLPKDPILVRLLEAANHVPDSQTMIQDAYGFTKTYPELLSDVFQTRDQLKSQLPPSQFDERGLLRDEHLYVTAVTRTGYEFAVAFFAVRALGGAFVPLDAIMSLDRLAAFVTKAKASAVLFDQGRVENARQVRDYYKETAGIELSLVPVTCTSAPLPSLSSVTIDESQVLEANSPGFVSYTSGTTGYSKGVVIRRACLAVAPLEKDGGAVVNYNASHWLGGTKNVIDGIVTGKMVYALDAPGNAAEILEHFQKYRITQFVFTPAVLRQMKYLLVGDKQEAPTEEEHRKFEGYFSGLSTFLCIGALLEQPTVEFWTKIIKHPYQNRYGTTELAGLPTTGLSKVIGSVGKPAPGIEIKLSEGTYGTLSIKSPEMFLGYLGDPEATKAAVDEEGYYKTGDVAELRDGELLFHGRARDDWVINGNSRISTVHVDRCLTDLPYVSEACTVAVPVGQGKQLCGVALKLKDHVGAGQADLSRIRSDLTPTLDEAMLPTLLVHLGKGVDYPRTATGKPIKRQVITDFFYKGMTGRDWFDPAKPPPGVECCSA